MRHPNTLTNLFCYIFYGAPLRRYLDTLTNLLCDTFCGAPLWLCHGVLGGIPNGTSSRGLEWESPQLPHGFTQGSGSNHSVTPVGPRTLRPDAESPSGYGMSSGTIIQVTLLEEVACQRTNWLVVPVALKKSRPCPTKPTPHASPRSAPQPDSFA